jgi:hypothetical protein
MAHAHDLRLDWRGRPVCGHRVPVCLLALDVRVARKRYHRLSTLQAQGRMHVQMNVRGTRVLAVRRPQREELLTDS